MGMQCRFVTISLFLIMYLGISSYFASKFVYRTRERALQLEGNRTARSYLENLIDYTSNGSAIISKYLKYEMMLELKRFLEVDSSYFSLGDKYKMNFNASDGARSNITDKDLFVAISSRVSGKDQTTDVCKSLVSGNDKFRWRAMQKIKSQRTEFSAISDKNLSIMFNNCDTISSFLKGDLSSTKRQERAIAFSILLTKPGHQTLQLLKAVYSPTNVYCLHVHSGATKRYFKLIKSISNCVGNIFLSPKRFRITLATFERVQAHLSCFQTLLNATIPWRYLITLTGSVFPLRNNTFIAEYLEKRHYKNGLTFLDRNRDSFVRRTKYVHELVKHPAGYEIFSRTKRRKRHPPGNITLFRSDGAFIATREFVEFIFSSNVARKLFKWSRNTKSPEEFYWATLDRLPGTPGGTPYRPGDEYPESPSTGEEDVLLSNENDLIAKLWKGQHMRRCGGVYTGNMCVYNYRDLRWLIGQDYLFADAFDLKIDFVAISCLYRNLQKPLIRDYY